MFAALHAPSMPATSLVPVAQGFTPRFDMLANVVLLDVAGLSRLFGGPHEIGEHLHRAATAREATVHVAVAPTAAAAILLALGRTGLSVVTSHDMQARLEALPVGVLRAFERIRLDWPAPALGASSGAVDTSGSDPRRADAGRKVPAIGSGHSHAEARHVTPASGGGWAHPRATHQAHHLRRPHRSSSAADRRARIDEANVAAVLDVLGRWGIATLGALAALPMPDVSERLGAMGTRWQRLARGEDDRPLVPWAPEESFDATLDLEWPIEGLEPLSFALTRLLDPLTARLERADRGVAIVHTRLRLVTRDVHVRRLQLPAPMREVKTLRTLMLLDLETNPPPAAIDRVSVLLEPTPGRVLQWTLFERAQPSPEQVSTLLARLTALMGQGRVGSPRLVDSWEPGALAMETFGVQSAECRVQSACSVRRAESPAASPQHSAPGTQHAALSTLHSVLRRFRLPVPARVVVHEGQPVRVQVDRHGLASGGIVQAAGPWRTSGGWWQKGQVGSEGMQEWGNAGMGECGNEGVGIGTHSHTPAFLHSHTPASWDRDEWDVALATGVVYRLFVERDVGQWFIEGVID
jgi:nucleotidyltransferase/DNA polymerase involved in DNA repair